MPAVRKILIHAAFAGTMLTALATATPASAQGSAQYWDGTNTTPGGVPEGRSGPGTWDNTTTNWTNAAGTANTAWNGGDAIFRNNRKDNGGNCVDGLTVPLVTIGGGGVSAHSVQIIGGCAGAIGLVRFTGDTLTLAADARLTGSADFTNAIVGLGDIVQGPEPGRDFGTVRLNAVNMVAGNYTITGGTILVVERRRVGAPPTAAARLTLGGTLRTDSDSGFVFDFGGEVFSQGGTLNGNNISSVTGALWDAGHHDIVIGDTGPSFLRVGGSSSFIVGAPSGDIFTKNGEIRADRVVLGQAAGGFGTLIVVVAGDYFGRFPDNVGLTQVGGRNDATTTGTVTAGTVLGGVGGGIVSFEGVATQTRAVRRANPLTFGPTLTGNLGVNVKSAEIHLTGTHDYTGATTLSADGLLYLDGANLTRTSVTVQNGVLGGFGTIGGAVTFSNGGTILEGRSGQTLGMGSLVLAGDTQVNVTLGAPNSTRLFDITGNLTLDGTLNITNAGAFGNGVYRLFDYGGTLTDNGLVIGTLPGASPASIQTSVARQVNLVVGNVAGPTPDILFWDGAGVTPNNAVNGGAGTWNSGLTNWTNAAGDTNYAWGGKFAVFQGTAGTVAIDAGGIAATGLQFASTGYLVQGGTLNLSAPATLRVGDGSAAGGTMAATIASVIAGSGGIDKTDMGTLILTGANSYSGPTLVSGGALIVNGSVIGATSVQSGARLGGTGAVGSLTIATGGTVAPGNSIGTLTVNGNYVQAANSTYLVEINPAGQSDRIQVSGTATIQGGTVSVTKAPGTYLPGTRFTIVNAVGGLTGTYASLVQDLPFVDLALAYDANNVFLDVARNNIAFCAVAATRNQCATGNGVESLGAGTLYNAVVSLPNDAAARAAFDALSGDIYASARGAMLADVRLPRHAVLSRLATADEGSGAWARGLGNWGSQDGDGNAFGLDRDTAGLIVGADFSAGPNWRFGLSAGYTHLSLDSTTGTAGADLNGTHLLAYTGGAYGPIRIRAGLGYADFDLDVNRAIAFAGFTDTARGKTGGSALQGFAELGYAFDLGGGELEPFAGLTAVRLRSGSFSETGGPAALSGTRLSDTPIYSTLGLRLGTAASANLLLNGSVAWRHAFGGVVPEARLAFAGGDDFTFAGTPLNRDEAAIEAGAAVRVAPGLALGIRYDGTIGGRSTDHSVQGSLTLAF